jgi:hypothetical protein
MRNYKLCGKKEKLQYPPLIRERKGQFWYILGCHIKRRDTKPMGKGGEWTISVERKKSPNICC